MEKKMRIFLFIISVFAVWACVPVPVPVDTTSPQGTYGYSDQSGYDEYGYGYDDYVDVPIVYGEPVYYTPPISVTFAFDYFTYEVDNGFVDIVFWKDGHRHHRERWYDHGRRISSQDIRSSRPNYRVRGPEFFEHRRKLEHNHHIAHPDSYYKLERRKQREKQRDQEDRFRQEQERREQQEKLRQKEERLKQEQELHEQKYRQKEQNERYRQEQEKLKQQEKLRQKNERSRQEQELRDQKYRQKEQEERNKIEMKNRAQEEKLRQKEERFKQQREKREQKEKEKKMKEHLKKDEKRKMDKDAVNQHIPPVY